MDDRYLAAREVSTWQEAYHEAERATGERATSFKNLRDEFDPWHPNGRLGWHKRPLRANRERVLMELREVSEDALLEMADPILARGRRGSRGSHQLTCRPLPAWLTMWRKDF